MLIEKIDVAAAKAGAEREKLSPIRLSNAGRCARQIAYNYHNFAGEPLSGRSIRVFEAGDRTEERLKGWAKKAGMEVEDEQKEVYLLVPDLHPNAVGHLDGTMMLDGERRVVEFKSINTLGFDRVVRDGVEYEYRCQVNAYMEAAGLRSWALVVFENKDTQHLHEIVVPFDPALIDEIRARFLRVMRSTRDNLPPREYSPEPERERKHETGRWKLPWQCAYCAYKVACWEVGEPEIKSGRPVWYVEPPKVEAVGGVRW